MLVGAEAAVDGKLPKLPGELEQPLAPSASTAETSSTTVYARNRIDSPTVFGRFQYDALLPICEHTKLSDLVRVLRWRAFRSPSGALSTPTAPHHQGIEPERREDGAIVDGRGLPVAHEIS
jgi:hypothetical protein